MKEKEKSKKEAGEKQLKLNTMQKTLLELEKVTPVSTKGKITEIIETTSKIFFKDDTGKYTERNGFAVIVNIPNPEGEEDVEFSQFMSLPDTRGLRQSNAYAFKRKYGKYPEADMEVDIFIDEKGFYRILLD